MISLNSIASRYDAQTAPLPSEAVQRARELIRSYGRRAPQHVVDQIQAAVRRGDDGAVTEADVVLRAIDREIQRLGKERVDAIQSGASNFLDPEASGPSR